MKARLILFAAIAMILVAFTFTAKGKRVESKKENSTQVAAPESGGLAMEDRNQWK